MNSRFNGIKALVIDNSSMRQIMISMLRTIGFKDVIIANNHKQCLDIIAAEKIDLIICGWAPPKLDALALLIEVRSSDKTIKIPFIIVSSIIEQDKIRQTILNGVSEYLVPPFNKKMFEGKISKALKLPLKLSASNLTSKLSQQSRLPISKKTDLSLLIVDDVADNIEIIKNLTQEHYQIKAAINAKSALKICLSDTPPDLILLDIMMPEVDGLTLCKQLKKNPITQNIVIIFLTALSETKDVVHGLSLGAVDYITKPIIPEILMARLNVHSTLIFNQRAIQNQIDSLLSNNATEEKTKKLLINDLSSFLSVAREGFEQLEYIKKTPALSQSISQINYGLTISERMLESIPVMKALEENNYLTNLKKSNIKNLLMPIIEIFEYAINDKNLEHFEEFDFNGFITCDKQLFVLLFRMFYTNAIEAAPKGSRVSVETQSIDHFILIKIHNIGVIKEEVFDNFDQMFISSKKNGVGLGMYLSSLIVKKMKSHWYFHSSERYGTTFYLKIKQ